MVNRTWSQVPVTRHRWHLVRIVRSGSVVLPSVLAFVGTLWVVPVSVLPPARPVHFPLTVTSRFEPRYRPRGPARVLTHPAPTPLAPYGLQRTNRFRRRPALSRRTRVRSTLSTELSAYGQTGFQPSSRTLADPSHLSSLGPLTHLVRLRMPAPAEPPPPLYAGTVTPDRGSVRHGHRVLGACTSLLAQ